MKGWIVVLALIHGADVASTCVAFTQGAREANPLVPSSCSAVIGVQAATTVVQAWAIHRLAETGHRRAAHALGAVSFTFEVGLTANNLRALR